jgi:two-component system NtrC family sensor kinase
MSAEHLLLVLSDPDLRQLLEQSILRPAGFEVTAAPDWATANQILKGHLPDLVIAGGALHHGDSPKWVTRLLERRPSLPILLIPKQYSDAEAIQAFRLGFADVIHPPPEPGELLNAIRRALQRRKHWEEQARLNAWAEAERKKLSAVLTKIDEGVIIIDRDGRLSLVNPAARAILGLEDSNWTGKPVQDVMHHPDILELVSQESRASPYRMEINLEQGRVIDAQVTPVQEVGLVVTLQDITHLKELDHIKSDFVNAVFHDLRSPLTAILGYMDLFDRVGTVNDQQREFIQRVQSNVHNITDLVNDLLDLSRIEADFDIQNEIVPFDQIIQDTVENWRGRMIEKRQQLDLDIPEKMPQVLGNPIRLKQMLNNLLGNAIKYTPRNGAICLNAQVAGSQIILQVTDNGPGISLDDQPFIFNKFFRGRNISDEVPGAGLGLAIVKSIVENHQGRIWVESAPGAGSTFTVVLPTIDQEL